MQITQCCFFSANFRCFVRKCSIFLVLLLNLRSHVNYDCIYIFDKALVCSLKMSISKLFLTKVCFLKVINTKTVVLFYHKNLFMFECDFQSTNILLLKMTYNINQTQYK